MSALLLAKIQEKSFKNPYFHYHIDTSTLEEKKPNLYRIIPSKYIFETLIRSNEKLFLNDPKETIFNTIMYKVRQDLENFKNLKKIDDPNWLEQPAGHKLKPEKEISKLQSKTLNDIISMFYNNKIFLINGLPHMSF